VGQLQRQQGVTLLELVMVMLVISLAVAISYPALSRGTVALHLRATGRSVLNTFRYAREQAITEQRVMKVSIDSESGTVTLSTELGEAARSFTLPDDVKVQGLMLAGEVVDEGPLVIRYLTNGSSQEAEVLLQSATGGLLRIVTDPITGGARIVFDRGDFVR
jgi:prepilin-type N-terminal cleavage/methylation domain-containing protein